MAYRNLYSFNSDDEDDMFLFNMYENRGMAAAPRRAKVFRNRPNYFEEYADVDFFTRFRMQKRTCEMLLNLIRNSIKSPTERNQAISPVTKLLLVLRFYATGSMLIAIGDFVGVSKASACKIVRQVSEAIAQLHGRFITFPETEAARQESKELFYQIARFPYVIGAIDCTHIRVQNPGGDDAELFRNRKGYFSWNVQTICDSRLRIINIVARWQGSCHDQTIFNNSRIKGRFENNNFPNCVIVGDSGCGNNNYLLTPLPNPNTAAENLYNEAHIRTRNCVERSYGVWKRRFPILSLGMRVSSELSKTIIVVAAVLHNICIEENDGNPPIEPGMENEIANLQPLQDNINNRMRSTL